MSEQPTSNPSVYDYLGASAKLSYEWGKNHGSRNGDAYVLACQIDVLVAEIGKLKRAALEPSAAIEQKARNVVYDAIDHLQGSDEDLTHAVVDALLSHNLLVGAEPPSDARYEWLKRNVSGREWRALGIVYSEPSQIDEQIDARLAVTKPARPFTPMNREALRENIAADPDPDPAIGAGEPRARPPCEIPECDGLAMVCLKHLHALPPAASYTVEQIRAVLTNVLVEYPRTIDLIIEELQEQRGGAT